MTEKEAARIIVLNEHGQVLLGKRNSKKDFGKLSIPGGKLNEKENSRTAAIREVEEETGLAIENPEFFTDSNFGGWLTFFYYAVIENIILPSPSEEHSQFLLLSLTQVTENEEQVGFNHADILKKFFEEKENLFI